MRAAAECEPAAFALTKEGLSIETKPTASESTFPEPDVTSQASFTFWKRMRIAPSEARLVAGSTQGSIVAARIFVMDDDAEIIREWKLDGSS